MMDVKRVISTIEKKYIIDNLKKEIDKMFKEVFPGEEILAPYVSVDGDVPKGCCADVSDERYRSRSSSPSVR